MTLNKKFLLISFLAWVFCQWTVLPAFAESDWKLSASATYDTGKYGTSTTTDTLYMPVTLKRYFDAGDISLTIPYVRQKSSGLVSIVDGTVFKTKKTGATAVTTNSGLGDIILKGSLYLLQEQKKQPVGLSLVGKIKFPTADDTKNLGTGAYDETIGLELGKQVLSGFTAFADAYYTFIGSPSGANLKNRFSFDLGMADQLAPDITASIFYEESTALTSGTPDARDIMVNVDYKVTKETHIFAGGELGLTDSSPDYGVTAGVSIKF